MSDIQTPPPPPINSVAFAQNAEDIVLLRAFKHVHGGRYVDVGAGHPVNGSLTANLIHRLGWTGVDIEPQSRLVCELEQAHPKSVVVQACAGQPGQRTFYRLLDNWGMSTLNKVVAERHKESGWTVEEETVEVAPLDQLLEGKVSPNFELLKIDVEGAETEVLETITLSYWRPKVIVIEATRPATTENSSYEWSHFLQAANYRLALFDGLNQFYVSSDAEHLTEELSVPASVFDRYIHLRWWDALSKSGREQCDPTGQFEQFISSVRNY